MTYVPYDGFLQEVLPQCPGVPELVAINAIRNAAIDFCEQSQWLQYPAAAIDGVANQAVYALAVLTDTRVSMITDAWWDTLRLIPKSEDQLAQLFGADWRTMQGGPNYYLRDTDPTSITVVPYPIISEPGALTMKTTLCPTRASMTVDPNLIEYWLEPIASGAKARLMAMPGQPYFNRTSALAEALMFRKGVSDAKIQVNRGLGRAVVNMRPPVFI